MDKIWQKLSFILFILFVYTIVAGGEQKPTDADLKGVVTYVDGKAHRLPHQQDEWINAPEQSIVVGGDKLKTLRQSRAEVLLSQADMIRLAPETIVDIVQLDQEERARKTSLKLESGDIWLNIPQLETNEMFDVLTDVSATAIRGTIFRMNVQPDSTTQIKVYEGQVEVWSLSNTTKHGSDTPGFWGDVEEVEGPKEITRDEWSQIVRAMSQLTISSNGTIQSEGSFSKNDNEEQSEWVKWNQARDKIAPPDTTR